MPIGAVVDVTVRLWHIVLATAVVALAMGLLVGRYAVPSRSATNGPSPSSSDAAEQATLNALRERERVSAAQANVRAAVPAMEAYNADHDKGYVGVTLRRLQESYDAGIANIRIANATYGGYCIENTAPATVTYHKSGPAGEIAPGYC